MQFVQRLFHRTGPGGTSKSGPTVALNKCKSNKSSNTSLGKREQGLIRVVCSEMFVANRPYLGWFNPLTIYVTDLTLDGLTH